MSETEEDLRTTSDAIVDAVGRLGRLEARKRKLDPDDGQRIGLSEKIAEVGRRLSEATAAEVELAREAHAEALHSPSAPNRSIADTPAEV
jgi:hypothetical protein